MKRAERRYHEKRVQARRVKQDLQNGSINPGAGKPYLYKSTASTHKSYHKLELIGRRAKIDALDYREQLEEAFETSLGLKRSGSIAIH